MISSFQYKFAINVDNNNDNYFVLYFSMFMIALFVRT